MWMWWVLKMMPHVTVWGTFLRPPNAQGTERRACYNVNFQYLHSQSGEWKKVKTDKNKSLNCFSMNCLNCIFDFQCLTRNTILHYKTPKPKKYKDKWILGNRFHSWCVDIVLQIFAGSLGRNSVGNWLVAWERTWRFIICFKFVWTQIRRQG